MVKLHKQPYLRLRAAHWAATTWTVIGDATMECALLKGVVRRVASRDLWGRLQFSRCALRNDCLAQVAPIAAEGVNMKTHSFRGLALLGVLFGLGACSSSRESEVLNQSGFADPPNGAPNAPLAQPGWGRPSQAAPSKSATRATGIVVKFKATGPNSVTESVDAILASGRSLSRATADGSGSLDHLVQKHQLGSTRTLLPWRSGLSTVAAQTRQKARVAQITKGRSLATAPAVELTNIYQFAVAGDVDAAVADLNQDPHVEYAQPNYEVHVNYVPNDPYLSSHGSNGDPNLSDLWGISNIGATAAWDTARGQGIVVAVIDTGIDRTHPDIAPNVWSNLGDPANGIDDDGNGLVDDTWGWDFAYGDNDTIDRFGHGTHVAGTIAAQDNNGVGIVGVAPDARVMAVKGLTDSGSGNTFNLAQAILYAAENGARVINNSWGCGGCATNPVIEDIIRQAHGLGAVVVFSSGNAGSDVVLGSPQNAPHTILVGASDPNGKPASFSNFGNIDVVAPGSGVEGVEYPGFVEPWRAIVSLKSTICSPALCPAGLIVGSNYVRQAGTSMAAPHVSGAAALILSQNPTYTPEQVRQVIRHSASFQGWAGSGYGRVSANAALLQPTPLEVLITNPHGQMKTNATTVTGTVKGVNLSSWTLAYSSALMPSEAPWNWTTLAAGTASVNDGALGSLDTSMLPDGYYTLRLRAQTTTGETYTDHETLDFHRVEVTAPSFGDIYRGGDQVTITGTVAPGDLDHYWVDIKTSGGALVPASQITLTNGGTSPVTNGVLATWNTAGAAADKYEIKLRVLLDGGSEVGSDVIPVVVDPLIHSGWPKKLAPDFEIGIYDTTTVGDVNGDGQSELVVGFGPTVQILRHDGTQLPGWPQPVFVGTPSKTQFSPAVGDITGDGQVEVVATNINGQIFVWNQSGQLLSGWPKTVGTGTRHRIALADIDGDGVDDIVSADDVGRVHVLRANGSSPPGFPVTVGSGIQLPPAVGDLDGDGHAEIVVLHQGTELTVVSYTGAIRPGFPKAGAFRASSVGDLDGDGKFEIVATSGNEVRAYRNDGTLMPGWPKSLANDYAFSVTVGDVDGDGRDEVFASAGDQATPVAFLHAWNGSGAALAGWPFSANGYASPAFFQGVMLADVDGNGQVEVVTSGVNVQKQVIDVIGVDGTLNGTLSRPSIYGSPGIEGCAAVADMDGDGLLEMAHIDGGGNLLVWDLPGAAGAAQPYPMFQRNPKHTGVPNRGRALPARIEAERYVRFNETTSTNFGASGSPACNRGDGVDIQATNDQNGQCSIGWSAAGEWLEYDVNVASAATFDAILRLGSGLNDKSVRLLVDGIDRGTRTAPNVGWSSFGDREISSIFLGAGQHVVRVEFLTSDVNFNYIDIRLHTPITLPGRIEAENFDRFNESDAPNHGALNGSVQCDQGSSVDLYHTSDQNGQCYVGWTQPGEWLEYDVFAPQSGNFSYTLRAGSGASNKALRLVVDGVQQTSFVVANSGNWDTFQNYSSSVHLSAGNHVLRVLFETDDVNLNYIELAPSP
jgi:subtilisin family serine protease